MILPATVAIAFVAASCGESKIIQCNKLNNIINQADITTNTAKTGKPPALIKAASELEKVAIELKALEVEDEKLRGLKSSFLIMYTDISKSFRKLAVAIERQDAEGIKSSLKFLKQARSKDRTLVKEINSYCQGK